MFEKCDLSLRNIRNFLLLQTWSGSDATGNVMAVYSSKDGGDNLLLAEQHIYGASRLGMRTADLNVSDPSVSSVSAGLIGSGYLDNFERGRKFFELSNHLGNSLSRTCGILVTISDRKILVKTGSGSESNGGCDAGTAAEELTLTERGTATSMVAKNRIRLLPGFSSGSGDSFTAYIDNSRPGCELADNPTANPDQYYYIADVISANDYYPGGMQMPGRTYNAGNYAYGFNGKRKDNEMYGEGNAFDIEARIYDPRLVHWLSVDKAAKVYPSISPYVFSANSPVQYKDDDGNIIRDKDGNIVFVEIGKTTEWEHGGNPGAKYNMSIGYIFADDGTKILVFKNTDVGKKNRQAQTDCHGVSFGDGQYWIDNNQVPVLLQHDGYSEVDYNTRKQGDKVVYTSNTDEVEDSRTVQSDVTKVYGQGGLEETSYESDIDKTWTKEKEEVKARTYRKSGKDKKFKTDREKDAFIKQKVFTFPTAKNTKEAEGQFKKEAEKTQKRSSKLKPNAKIKPHVIPKTKP